MRRLRTHYLWLWSVPLLVCAGLAFAGDAPAKPGSSAKARMLLAPSTLSGKVTLSRTSSAHSGLKLLEDILGRVRSVPQLAMNVKQNRQSQRQEIAQQAQQGPTNYQLAIRPNESSWRQQQRLNAAGQKEGKVSSGWGNKNVVAGKSKKSTTPGIWEKDDNDFLMEQSPAPRRRSDVIAYGANRSVNAYQSAAPAAPAVSASSGIWEAEPQRKVQQQLTPSQERLKVAAGKLYDLSRKFEAANEIASTGSYVGGYGVGGGGGGGTSASSAGVRGTLTRSSGIRKDALDKAHFYKAPQRLQITDDAPVVRDYRGSAEEAGSMERGRLQTIEIPVPTPTAAAPAGLVPAPPASYLQSAMRPRVAQSVTRAAGSLGPTVSLNQLPPTRLSSSAADTGLDENVYGDEASSLPGDRESRIAILPPNVFTGIPMVRLGISEKQAGRALAASGSMDRQRINGWSVWTCFKPGTREPALQVYMRHGQVDAVRTFDASLVGTDFGVRLGDSLAAVKERFGEPAFIIPEPTPGAGQNYVYPISQVAFLIARPSPNAAPQVTGLFIFNVK